MNPVEIAKLFHDGYFYGIREDAARLGRPLKAVRAELTPRSLVLTTESSVLKLRRPLVRDGFDLRERALRLAMSARERSLGDRLTPGLYHPLLVMRLPAESLGKALELAELDAVGEPVVALARLPDEARADRVLCATEDPPLEPFLAAVERLAELHGASPSFPDAPGATPEAFAAAIGRHLAALTPALLTPAEAAALEDALLAARDAIAPTLAHRIREGRVRELHGAVRLEHLFLPPGRPPAFIAAATGAVEQHVRDVATDVLPLALECKLLAGKSFSDAILEAYAAATEDHKLRKVAPFLMRMAALELAVAALEDGAPERAGLLVAHAREHV